MRRSSKLRAFVKVDSNGNYVPNVLIYRTKQPKEGIWVQLDNNVCCPMAPDAPSAAVVDDDEDTFDWTNSELYPSLADYEFTDDGGDTWSVVTEKPLTGLTGAIDAGEVGVRVRASGGRPASEALFNDVAYTA